MLHCREPKFGGIRLFSERIATTIDEAVGVLFAGKRNFDTSRESTTGSGLLTTASCVIERGDVI
jgi:hypothetical protein